MKILFVTLRPLESNSSVTISNFGLIKGFLEMNYQVDILMPYWNKERDLNYYYNEIAKKINIVRIKGKTSFEKLNTVQNSHLKSKLINVLKKVYYKISIFDHTKFFINYADINTLNYTKYDIVISTSDPKTSHLFVSKLKEQGLKYKVWIQHWGDPLSLDITRKSIFPKSYIKRIEEKILDDADKIIYVSPITWIEQKKLFPKQSNKIHFVPLPYYKTVEHNKIKNNRFTIGYFGDYNSKIRNIIPLYEYVSDNKDLNLIVAGNSDLKLQSKENIKIYPRLKQDELGKLESECDLLICICNKSGTQIPGKIYYYAATNKPILIILDGEYKSEIRKFLSVYKRFHFCDNNMNSIGEKILELSNVLTNEKPCLDFSPKKIAKKIIEVANL